VDDVEDLHQRNLCAFGRHAFVRGAGALPSSLIMSRVMVASLKVFWKSKSNCIGAGKLIWRPSARANVPRPRVESVILISFSPAVDEEQPFRSARRPSSRPSNRAS
jgi:hypothetical protein